MTKIDIFSGFLGAGKTTLIRKLIKEAYAGEKLVLIENEFGEIGVDSGFLQDSGVQINEMNSGCICCSLVGDFTKALRQVMTDFAPDRILIEPSGVGKLSDVKRAVEQAAHDAVLNAPVTVVDAAKCKIYAKNFGEFYNDQLESAGCIVLSRTADISEAKLQKALEIIRSKNAEATVITTPWEQLDGKQILAAMEQENTLARVLEELEEEHQHHHEHHHDEHCDCHEHEHHHHHDEHCDCHEHEHHHHDHDEHCSCGCHDHEHHHEHHDHDEHCSCGCHDHHHHHADEVFTSFGRETAKKYTADGLRNILEALLEESKYGQVLRAKGMVENADGGWLHFDYVPGEINVRPGQPDVMGKICVIGSGMDQTAIAGLFELED